MASIGELPQHVERQLNVAGEGNGIEHVKLVLQSAALLGGEHPGGQDPLVRREGGVIVLADVAADPLFAQELADGAEEVVRQAEQAVEALQDSLGRAGAIAVVAHEAADDEAVALLDPGLIVLAIGAAAREPHARSGGTSRAGSG